MNIDENNIIKFYMCDLMYKSIPILFDVGAHKGGSSSPFLKKGWNVYAFEPDKHNRKYLQRFKKQYPKLNIDTRAVSDEIKSNIPFYTSEVSSGISGLSKFHESHEESNKVDTTTIKQFCLDNNIEKIDYLKIDTEGFDLFVLKGVPWDKIKPKVILCEFEDRKTIPLGYTFYDFADFLVNKGYELIISEWYPIVEYGTSHSWNCFKKYPCRLDSDDAWGNIIAFKDKIDYLKFTNAVAKAPDEADSSDKAKLKSVYSSRSWKITRPLRFLANLKRKLNN